MSVYTIPTPLFNAVLSARADKNDPRTYLQGFFIDTETDRIVATNGWMMCVAPIEYLGGSEKPKSVIYGGIPKPVVKSDKVDIYLDEDRAKLLGTSRRYKGTFNLELKRLEGIYPYYARVMANNEGRKDLKPLGSIAFNPELLYRPAKWARVDLPVAELWFGRDKSSSIEVRFKNAELRNLHMTLMPCRP